MEHASMHEDLLYITYGTCQYSREILWFENFKNWNVLILNLKNNHHKNILISHIKHTIFVIFSMQIKVLKKFKLQKYGVHWLNIATLNPLQFFTERYSNCRRGFLKKFKLQKYGVRWLNIALWIPCSSSQRGILTVGGVVPCKCALIPFLYLRKIRENHIKYNLLYSQVYTT
jgi:hypothetical protein